MDNNPNHSSTTTEEKEEEDDEDENDKPKQQVYNHQAFSITFSEKQEEKGKHKHKKGEKEPTMTPKTHAFVCAFYEHKQAWLDAFEISVIRAHQTHKQENPINGDDNDGNDDANQLKIGWQHEIIQTSIHSAAYLGNVEMLRRAIARLTTAMDYKIQSTAEKEKNGSIDQLDEYGNQLSALHYASMYNHLDCMEELLKAGANPNCLDGNGDEKTPLWYANQNKHSDAVKLLLSKGADKKHLKKNKDENNRNALFGNLWNRQAADGTDNDNGKNNNTTKKKIETYTFRHQRKNDDGDGDNKNKIETYTFRNQRKKNETPSAAADNANNKVSNITNILSENMIAMRERGEKIERLDDRTKELQDAASEYRDLARKLKEKQKKQATFFGFQL
mmetsp:Transcript_1318/g.1833  ORF Transcript_1318/g.1833 Transcript_1318/m.1833 type:complete len:389 (+) Transcript_1318:316-1482(+)